MFLLVPTRPLSLALEHIERQDRARAKYGDAYRGDRGRNGRYERPADKVVAIDYDANADDVELRAALFAAALPTQVARRTIALRGATYRAERAPDGALVHPSSVNAEIARGKRVDDAPWPPADWLLYREVK